MFKQKRSNLYLTLAGWLPPPRTPPQAAHASFYISWDLQVGAEVEHCDFGRTALDEGQQSKDRLWTRNFESRTKAPRQAGVFGRRGRRGAPTQTLNLRSEFATAIMHILGSHCRVLVSTATNIQHWRGGCRPPAPPRRWLIHPVICPLEFGSRR